MTQRDIKLLWGRAGARCSLCRRKLTENPTAATAAFPVGVHAHIVGDKPDSARADSPLTADERDGYPNHILLCPTDHTLIDNAEADYPVERLHIKKREHELWVEQQLGGTDENDEVAKEIYASLVDACVEYGGFSEWNLWTGWAVSSSPRWRADGADRASALGKKVLGAAWPGKCPELERALRTFAHCLHTAAQRFWNESETQGDYRVGVRFYKNARKDEDYALLLDRYEEWVADCDRLIILATKAANWLADVVRRDLNPRFFAMEGRFVLTMEDRLSYVADVPEFTEDEKIALPESLLKEDED